MRINSRTKGKVGELEASQLLKDMGFECRRGQQFAGGTDSPDIVHNIPGIHFEVKRTQRLNVYKAMDQANNDKRPTEDAIVLHRANKRRWVAIIDAEVLLKLFKDYIVEPAS